MGVSGTHASHASKASRQKKNVNHKKKSDYLAPGDSFYGFEEVKLEDHVMYLENSSMSTKTEQSHWGFQDFLYS